MRPQPRAVAWLQLRGVAWPVVGGLSAVAAVAGAAGIAWRDSAPGAHIARAAKFYVWGQAEAGHGCPISMTYAIVPALRHAERRRQPVLRAVRLRLHHGSGTARTRGSTGTAR